MNKFIYTMIAAVGLSLFTSCDFEEDLDQPNYVSFGENSANVGVDVGGSSTYTVPVYAANITGSDRQVELMVDESTTLSASAYTVPGSVTIPAGSNEAMVDVQVSDVDLGLAGKSLVLSLKEGNELFTGEELAISVNRTCVGKEFVIDITFDAYPGETGWEILDADGNSVIAVASGNAVASRSLCLSPGTYTFVLKDSYGDGIFDGGATLSYAGTVLATVSGDFGFDTSVEFSF